MKRHAPALSMVFIVIASITLGAVCWGENLKARWGILDDHEIAYFLGDDGRLGFSEIPSLLMKTEVGRAGAGTRFRPSYYSLRLLETALWGDSPFRWYLARIVLFCFSFAALCWLLSRALGTPLGVLGGLWILSAPYWSDLWARLGPGETYTAPALALHCLAWHRLWTTRSQPAGHGMAWALLAASAVVAMGSKENFLLLMATPVALMYLLPRDRWQRPSALASGGVILLFGAWIAASVGLALVRRGHDVYGNSVAPADRLAVLWIHITKLTPLHTLTLAVGAALAILWLAHRVAVRQGSPPPDAALEIFTRLFFIEVGLLALYASQVVFYNGEWPVRTRYDFPGMLAIPLGLLAPLACLRFSAHRIARGPLLVRGASIATAAALSAFVVVEGGIAEHREASHENVKGTTTFTGRIEKAVQTIRKRPAAPILLDSHGLHDYEPIFSVARFLRMHGLDNPIALRIHGYSSQSAETSHGRSLAATLERVSREGDADFSPLAQMDLSDCFAVSLSGRPEPPCEPAGWIW